MDKLKALSQKIKKFGIARVAKDSNLNKSTISRYVHGQRQYSIENFEKLSATIETLELAHLHGRTSANEASKRVILGENWQIAYFDFVDSFLATKSVFLVKEMPVDGLSIKLLALLCSMVLQLCDENKITPPEWARLSLELEEPWFISKFKNLRAISLVESPIYFKRNNIFVGADFLKRV